MRAGCLVVVAFGCSKPHTVGVADAALPADSAPADSSPAFDASLDAKPDAYVTYASPRCTTAPTVLFDATPNTAGNIAIASDVLYVGVFEGSAGMIVSIDPSTGEQVDPPFATPGQPWLWSDGTDVIATTGTAIWRLHPGAAPSELVSGRTAPFLAIDDSQYLYWTEEGSVWREAIAGGSATSVLSCTDPTTLDTDATNVYCAGINSSIAVGAKDGTGTPTGVDCPLIYPVASMVRDGSELYALDLYPMWRVWSAPTPTGPCTVFDQSTAYGRAEGLAATSDTFYVVDSFAGVWTIDRTTMAATAIYSEVGLGDNPIAWHGQLFFEAPNPNVAGQTYVMRCID
ncbi:MAG TPA: hypothetical protein VH143_31840 [Kofleriaceae bacterium]|nr:hypothetical protein [Kofleriaceae bacterium]